MYRGDSTRNFRDDEKNHICNPIYPSYERIEWKMTERERQNNSFL